MCRGGGSGREEKRSREGGKSALPTGPNAGGTRTLLLLQPPPSTQLRCLGLTCSRPPLPGLFLTLQEGPGVGSLAILLIDTGPGWDSHSDLSKFEVCAVTVCKRATRAGALPVSSNVRASRRKDPPSGPAGHIPGIRALASPDMSKVPVPPKYIDRDFVRIT